MEEHDPADLVEALRAENEALSIRVSQLEAATTEYRRQMSEVLTSVSWRLTSPLRNVAGRGRLLRSKVRQAPRRLSDRGRGAGTPALGLFPPDPDPLLTLASPLLSLPLGQGPWALPPLREPVPGAPRVLVVAHVYYPEVWPDIEDRLARIPEAYDLVVTLVSGRAESLEREINRRLPHARIHHVQNGGRDLGPLIELANLGLMDGYDAVLKVHTKRSPHRLDGDAWRVTLLDGVLPSPAGVRRVLELLRSDGGVGLVAPTGHVKGPETWGSDQVLVQALAARIPFAFDPDGLRYPAGSMYWARPWVLQRLADLQLTSQHFEPEADHLDGSTAHALERYVGVSSVASGLDVIEMAEVPSRLQRARARRPPRARVLAFYLPQYHRNADNDAFWGDGFTDWVNVDRATPLYSGHLQPQQPGELGRYDLADPDVLRQQAGLARDHGVDALVLHHYWFDGRKVLDLPLRNLLADPTIDLPFALCWANEPWTRSWDGLDGQVLIPQRYGEGYADRFYDDLRPALHDPRYVRVDGKPLLVVYRIGHLHEPRAAVTRWKQRAEQDGLGGLHVLAVVPSRDFEGLPAGVDQVLDGLVRFPPGSGVGLQDVGALAPDLIGTHSGKVYSYDAAVDGGDLSTRGAAGLRLHPGVMPGWDNTPRRGDAAYVFHGSNPLSFRRWLVRAAGAAEGAGPDPLVFVNAWNEWAEGAHLEPDARFGRAYLAAVADVMRRAPDARPSTVGGIGH